jgi:hypothetical protein
MPDCKNPKLFKNPECLKILLNLDHKIPKIINSLLRAHIILLLIYVGEPNISIVCLKVYSPWYAFIYFPQISKRSNEWKVSMMGPTRHASDRKP